MPESAQFLKKNDSSGTSCESSSDASEWEEEGEKDQNEKREKKVTYDLEDRKLIERSSKLKKYSVNER